MTLISQDELIRGIALVVFGGLSGSAVVALPGSPLWIVPAALGVGLASLTIPEVQEEVRKALPHIAKHLPATVAALPQLVRPIVPDTQLSARAQEGQPEIFRMLNDDGYHRLIIGYTGGGKTTLMHKLATDWAARGVQVVVCDPDAAYGMWPGCTVAGGGDNYEAIGAALARVYKEVSRRRAQRAKGVRSFSPFHVVCDETHDIVAEVPSAWAILTDIIRRGRKISVFLTIGVPDKQVKTLKLEGQSALLGNLMKAEVQRQAGGKRVAVIEKEVYPIPQLPNPEAFITRRVGDEDALLHALLRSSAAGSEVPASTRHVPAVWNHAPPGSSAAGSEVPGSSLVPVPVITPVEIACIAVELEHKAPWNQVPPGSSAAGSEVPGSSLVPAPVITPAEIACIAVELEHKSPTEVVKGLPGYHARKFAEFKAKVDYVKSLREQEAPHD